MFKPPALIIALFLCGLSTHAEATYVRVQIEDMTCVSCQEKVVSALDKLSGLSLTQASTAAGLACAELRPSAAELACANIAASTAAQACNQAARKIRNDAVRSALAELGYGVTEITEPEVCDLSEVQFQGNWAQTDGLDVQIISRGERVELTAHLANDKYTLFDFGAPWCVPCHAAEALIKRYMQDHPDVALRAIVLDSQDPKVSYAMPVVSQHLLAAPGLPYFMVMSPSGKTIAKGVDLPKLLKKLDRKR